MSLAGASADKRIPLTIADQKKALVKLYNAVTGSATAVGKLTKYDADVEKAAQQLKASASKGVVVTGLDDFDAQLLVLAINNALQSQAFNPTDAKLVRKGDAKAVNQLVADMNAGKIHTLIMSGVNPVYTLPNAKEFVAGLGKVKVSVAFSTKEDETAKVASIAAAATHYLESWGDVMLTRSNYSLVQPTIRPLFDTKNNSKKHY